MRDILVTYFSATGVTKRKAMKLAKALDADIYEIEPKIPYTKDDLNWMNSQSRSSKEMADKAYRPELVEGRIDIAGYNTIYLGFPIWWYVAPTIVNTFLEKYDFTGKKIVIFATSGGSGFGKTLDELKVSLPDNVTIIQGMVVNDENDIMKLVELS